MAKVLVTGATGYVGKRLIMYLLNQGHEIYALCYIKGVRVFEEDKKNLSYIWGDLRNPETLQSLPQDIEAAYYLVHSMSEVVSDREDEELQVVKNFIEGIKKTRIQQIIYLGGIINDEKTLSQKLQSRLSVEEALKGSGLPTTILRAGIIIGAGSAAFSSTSMDEEEEETFQRLCLCRQPKAMGTCKCGCLVFMTREEWHAKKEAGV
ncbi:MAG: NmrA family NAD(P)-binding protein [Chlamydiota bacterium]